MVVHIFKFVMYFFITQLTEFSTKIMWIQLNFMFIGITTNGYNTQISTIPSNNIS